MFRQLKHTSHTEEAGEGSADENGDDDEDLEEQA